MSNQGTSATGGSSPVGGGQGVSVSDSADGEDQEDSSSSSSISKQNDIEDALASFREQWQRELVVSSKQEVEEKKSNVKSNQNIDNESFETKAKTLFIKGVEHEQAGKLYEAIQYYRRAVQLVPDIEFKFYESVKSKPRENDKDLKSEVIKNDAQQITRKKYEDSKDLEGLEFLPRMQKIVNKYGCLCIPEIEAQCTHISALPMEILLYILRWVVSSELDLRSFEKFGSVCRGFYVCSRDSEIWRLACARVWGINCGSLGNPYNSWRQMFIERPRLHFNGCYISKTTYIRHGENSFQDQFYRPWHLVEYYRYLRFFPEGIVLMLTTSEEPAQCVTQLRHRTPKNSNILVGHYRLKERCVTLLVQRQESCKITNIGHRLRRHRESIVDAPTQTFHLDLQIQNHRKRAHAQLSFQSYRIFTKHKNGTESNSSFELVKTLYPPLWFSRVKSYTLESENPLQ